VFHIDHYSPQNNTHTVCSKFSKPVQFTKQLQEIDTYRSPTSLNITSRDNGNLTLRNLLMI